MIDPFFKNPISPRELKVTMRELGCERQQDLADLIGVKVSTVGTWVQGKVGVPTPVRLLLRLMVREKYNA